MASQVEIANVSLGLCGSARINAVTEDSKGAQYVNQFWALARQYCISGHPWNFALKRRELAAQTTSPVFEWDYAYPLPEDCLRAWQVGEPEDEIEWRVEEVGEGDSAVKCVVTNSSTCKLLYTYDVTDTGRWSPYFAVAMAYVLATWLCFPITADDAWVQRIQVAADRMIGKAKAADAQEGTPDLIITSDWENARLV